MKPIQMSGRIRRDISRPSETGSMRDIVVIISSGRYQCAKPATATGLIESARANAPEARGHQLRRRDLTARIAAAASAALKSSISLPACRRRLVRAVDDDAAEMFRRGASSLAPRARGCDGGVARSSLLKRFRLAGRCRPSFSSYSGKRREAACDPVSRPDRLGSAPRGPERTLHRRTGTRRLQSTHLACDEPSRVAAGTRPGSTAAAGSFTLS
jgi:hypothetical protein